MRSSAKMLGKKIRETGCPNLLDLELGFYFLKDILVPPFLKLLASWTAAVSGALASFHLHTDHCHEPNTISFLPLPASEALRHRPVRRLLLLRAIASSGQLRRVPARCLPKCSRERTALDLVGVQAKQKRNKINQGIRPKCIQTIKKSRSPLAWCRGLVPTTSK